LRGASKDVLNEIDRNLQDALCVMRNIVLDPRLVAAGGAVEMALSTYLTEKSKTIQGIQQWPYQAVATALEVIPKTLAQNCGANVIKTITELRAKHAADPKKVSTIGIDGNSGQIIDLKAAGIWEPLVVKVQTIKTSIETACLLLRVDDVLSGMKKKSDGGQGGAQGPSDDGDAD